MPSLIKRVNLAWRMRTSGLRMQPRFLVIGEAKCATTTLHDHLVRSRHVRRARRKEINFFNTPNWLLGLDWYRAHFPMGAVAKALSLGAEPLFTGDASVLTLRHPLALQRVRSVYPDIRLIVCLRDPVARAFSHWQHSRRSRREPLEFAAALAAEGGRLAGERERLERDEAYDSPAWRHWSYRDSGLYADGLARALALFPREQLLVVRTEDLASDPQGQLDRVNDHIGAPRHRLRTFPRSNRSRSGERIDPAVAEELRAFYAPHNRRIGGLLGFDPGW